MASTRYRHSFYLSGHPLAKAFTVHAKDKLYFLTFMFRFLGTFSAPFPQHHNENDKQSHSYDANSAYHKDAVPNSFFNVAQQVLGCEPPCQSGRATFHANILETFRALASITGFCIATVTLFSTVMSPSPALVDICKTDSSQSKEGKQSKKTSEEKAVFD